MTKTIKPIAKTLGFPEVHWHALRHWNNSAMLNSRDRPRRAHEACRAWQRENQPDLQPP